MANLPNIYTDNRVVDANRQFEEGRRDECVDIIIDALESDNISADLLDYTSKLLMMLNDLTKSKKDRTLTAASTPKTKKYTIEINEMYEELRERGKPRKLSLNIISRFLRMKYGSGSGSSIRHIEGCLSSYNEAKYNSH